MRYKENFHVFKKFIHIDDYRIEKDSELLHLGWAEIIKEPIGKFQEEKYGRQINGIWVKQWSVGMEGDSWEGFICVQIKQNKYLKFGYSM